MDEAGEYPGLPCHQSQGGGWGGQVHENSRDTPPFSHIPPAMHQGWTKSGCPWSGTQLWDTFWVEYAEGTVSAALTIL